MELFLLCIEIVACLTDERVEESPTPSANNTSGENLKKNPIFSLDLSDKFASLRDQFSHRWKFLQNRSIERVAQKEQNHKEHFSNDDEYFEKDNEQGVDSTPSETDVSQLELINKRQRKSVKSKSASLGATSKRISNQRFHFFVLYYSMNLGIIYFIFFS